MCDWNLDDEGKYFKLFSAKIPYAYVWGNWDDRDRRENIRRELVGVFPDTDNIPRPRWWAFRIFAEKGGCRWDVDNLPKLVVDALSREQLREDNSEFQHMALYENDTVEFVRMVQVAGEKSERQDRMVIEVFGARWCTLWCG